MSKLWRKLALSLTVSAWLELLLVRSSISFQCPFETTRYFAENRNGLFDILHAKDISPEMAKAVPRPAEFKTDIAVGEDRLRTILHY